MQKLEGYSLQKKIALAVVWKDRVGKERPESYVAETRRDSNLDEGSGRKSVAR